MKSVLNQLSDSRCPPNTTDTAPDRTPPPENHSNLTASPQTPGPQPLRRCSGTGQAASWLPGTLAPLGVSQAQQSCLGAPASRPMMVSQPGAGGVLPAAMAPAPPRAPTGRAGRGHPGHSAGQTAGAARGTHSGHLRTAESRQPMCCPLPAETRVCRRWDSRGVTASRLPGGFPSLLPKPPRNQEVGVPNGPTRSLMGPQSPASRPPRAGFRPSSAAPRGALLALLRQQGPWALVPTASPPAVKTASKGSPAALSSLKGLARPSPWGRGAHPLWALAPVWTGGEPRAELRSNADRRRPPAGTAGGPHKSALCWAQDTLWAGRQLPAAETWGFDCPITLEILRDRGQEKLPG